MELGFLLPLGTDEAAGEFDWSTVLVSCFLSVKAVWL